jgi:hypothetical protein
VFKCSSTASPQSARRQQPIFPQVGSAAGWAATVQEEQAVSAVLAQAAMDYLALVLSLY